MHAKATQPEAQCSHCSGGSRLFRALVRMLLQWRGRTTGDHGGRQAGVPLELALVLGAAAVLPSDDVPADVVQYNPSAHLMPHPCRPLTILQHSDHDLVLWHFI